jgi:hypothetical protein
MPATRPSYSISPPLAPLPDRWQSMQSRLLLANSCLQALAPHLQCSPFWCPRGIPAARYYPRGTGGGELVAGYRISSGRRYRDPFCNAQKSIGGEYGLLHNLLFNRSNMKNTWQRPAIQLCSRGEPPIRAAYLNNKAVIFPDMPLLWAGRHWFVCHPRTLLALSDLVVRSR